MNRLKNAVERLRSDERAVSPVVGFVLIFALIMMVWTIYNADVVPQQNEQVEYEHSQTIEGQMEELSAAFLSADQDGSTRSVALQLGVQYPNRVLGINPGTPVGTISTTDTYDVTLTGDGGSMDLNTSFIDYSPNYNLMQQETQHSIEHGLLVKDYGEDNTRLLSTGALFSSNDKSVNLRLISSNLQESRMSTVVTADNVDTHTTTVTSEEATLTLPTTLEADEWDRIINGSEQVIRSEYHDTSGEVDTIDIVLKNGTEINVNRVTAGSPPPEGEIGIPPYLENVTQTTIENATANTTTNLTVRAVDVFGSPYKDDVEIEATASGGDGELTPATTGSNGTTTFTYESVPSDAGGTVTVNADLADRKGDNTSVTFEIQYASEESDESASTGDTITPGDVDSPPLETRAVSRSKTHPSFKLVVPSENSSTTEPIQISGFAVETKDDLSDLSETQESPGGRTHNFYIYDTGLEYDSDTPLQLDGTKYLFDTEGATTESRVQLERFNPSEGIRLEDTVDSYEEADITYWFVLSDGTIRPIYFDATTG